jgi:beta-phosphoglucomutase-like phosphatase (HAD superfamily)
VDPQECIVFEDSPSGARAGVAAGAYVVGILSGQDRSTLLDAGCSLLIQDYDDPALWAHLESRVLVKTS